MMTSAQVLATRWNIRVATKLCPKESEMLLRLGIIATVIFGALFVVAQDVHTDYDHTYNFSQLHTFAVKIGTSWGNPLTEQRAKDAVTNQLTQKGWTPAADEASADALVVIHGATQDKKSLDTFYSGGWGGYGWGGFGAPGMSTTTVNNYKVGTMVVDVFDAKTKKLVFRGVGEDEVSDKADKNTKKLDKAAEKMFKNFPPKEKEKS
jgi:hypothetical protein